MDPLKLEAEAVEEAKGKMALPVGQPLCQEALIQVQGHPPDLVNRTTTQLSNLAQSPRRRVMRVRRRTSVVRAREAILVATTIARVSPHLRVPAREVITRKMVPSPSSRLDLLRHPQAQTIVTLFRLSNVSSPI